jgi:ribonuclease HI
MTVDYVIYTDGSHTKKPISIGGWGYVIYSEYNTIEGYGWDLGVTHQKMELLAALEALTSIEKSSTILLFTDSEYVLRCANSGSEWAQIGWVTKRRHKPIKHKEIIAAINKLNKKHKIIWQWVKGHSGNQGNNAADKLATKGVEEARDIIANLPLISLFLLINNINPKGYFNNAVES